MTDEPNLRDDLLKQNGTSVATFSEIRDKILATDQARVRRMKRIAGICWAMFLGFFLLAALLEYGRRHGLPFLEYSIDEALVFLPEFRRLVPRTLTVIIIGQAWFFLAVVMTFSLHARSRTLTIHQIQASLAGIEERLKKMAETD